MDGATHRAIQLRAARWVGCLGSSVALAVALAAAAAGHTGTAVLAAVVALGLGAATAEVLYRARSTALGWAVAATAALVVVAAGPQAAGTQALAVAAPALVTLLAAGPHALRAVALLAAAIVGATAWSLWRAPATWDAALATAAGFAACAAASLAAAHLRAQLGETIARLRPVDPLTGAWLPAKLDEVLTVELARFARHGTPVSLVALDLDDLKVVNATRGRAAGDAVLRGVAATLQRALRATDLVVRTGGDTFLVVCRDTAMCRTDGRAAEAIRLAERLRRMVTQTTYPPWGRISVSLGVAEALPGDTPAALLDRVARALYRSKRAARTLRRSQTGTEHAAMAPVAVH